MSGDDGSKHHPVGLSSRRRSRFSTTKMPLTRIIRSVSAARTEVSARGARV